MRSLTRGPLPDRVYWTRRVMVLATAVLLVFGIARVLTGGSDGSSEPEAPAAVQVAATPTTPVGPSVAPPAATRSAKQKPDKQQTDTAPPLPEPDGPCADEDIAVTPVVKDAVAGADDGIRLRLKLRTIEAEACTWEVSPETLTVKITSGKDDIWSSRQCPRPVRTRDVVVRKEVSREVEVVWNGRRSDDECSAETEWALPGWYHVAASALAGEPSDVQFELDRPRRMPASAPAENDGDQQGDRDRDSDRDKNRDGDRDREKNRDRDRDREKNRDRDRDGEKNRD